MRNNYKKIVSCFMVFVVFMLVTCFFNINTVYANSNEFLDGDGTKTNPYLISTKYQLNNVSNHLDAYYKLVSNISFLDSDFESGGSFYNDGSLFIPFSSSDEAPFTGQFDGNGFSINNIKLKDGILNIPRKYMNKELCIGLYAIKNINVSVIYIPDTVHTIYGGNFTGIGNATIYYEGTEDEWKALFYSQSDVVTKNVVYNLKRA